MSLAFVNRFRKLILLANFSSLYISMFNPRPNARFKIDLIFLYCVVTTLMPLSLAIDDFALVHYSNLPIIDLFGLFFLGISFLWSTIKRVFFLTNNRKIFALFQFWSQELRPEQWSHIRKDFIEIQYSKILRVTYVSLACVVGPMVAVSLTKLFWTRALFFRSTQDMGHYFEESDWKLITYQAITVISINSSWVLSEAFVSLLLNLIIAEYHYLGQSFKMILDTACSQNNGNHDLKKCNKIRLRLRKQLSCWVSYHAKVIQFVNMIQDFYSPLMAGHFLHVTIAACGIIFNSIALKMPMDVAFLSYVYVLPRIFMTLRICRFGDFMAQKSSNCTYDNFSSHLTSLPTDITRSLLFIGDALQKPAQISLKGLLKLNSETFRKAMFLQYQFFTFLQDMQYRQMKKGN